MTTSHYQAARENLFGHVPFLQRRMPGMLIRDLGGALLVDSGLGSDTFNKVLWECGGDGRPCRGERGAEDGLLQASKDWFDGAPVYGVGQRRGRRRAEPPAYGVRAERLRDRRA